MLPSILHGAQTQTQHASEPALARIGAWGSSESARPRHLLPPALMFLFKLPKHRNTTAGQRLLIMAGTGSSGSQALWIMPRPTRLLPAASSRSMGRSTQPDNGQGYFPSKFSPAKCGLGIPAPELSSLHLPSIGFVFLFFVLLMSFSDGFFFFPSLGCKHSKHQAVMPTSWQCCLVGLRVSGREISPG